MALNHSIIFKENTQSNVQPRKTTFEQYIVYGIPFRCSQYNIYIATYLFTQYLYKNNSKAQQNNCGMIQIGLK